MAFLWDTSGYVQAPPYFAPPHPAHAGIAPPQVPFIGPYQPVFPQAPHFQFYPEAAAHPLSRRSRSVGSLASRPGGSREPSRERRSSGQSRPSIARAHSNAPVELQGQLSRLCAELARQCDFMADAASARRASSREPGARVVDHHPEGALAGNREETELPADGVAARSNDSREEITSSLSTTEDEQRLLATMRVHLEQIGAALDGLVDLRQKGRPARRSRSRSPTPHFAEGAVVQQGGRGVREASSSSGRSRQKQAAKSTSRRASSCATSVSRIDFVSPEISRISPLTDRSSLRAKSCASSPGLTQPQTPQLHGGAALRARSGEAASAAAVVSEALTRVQAHDETPTKLSPTVLHDDSALSDGRSSILSQEPRMADPLPRHRIQQGAGRHAAGGQAPESSAPTPPPRRKDNYGGAPYARSTAAAKAMDRLIAQFLASPLQQQPAAADIRRCPCTALRRDRLFSPLRASEGKASCLRKDSSPPPPPQRAARAVRHMAPSNRPA
eukprot:TRINITY_DN32093_c0_g2_i1.p1 TRINITY_DN32093_c0_g2~~TRINITY_DN32093_c0_g2_i1.p1  ORF type:complete len:502 (+),score=66.60 TRINITY_DN32093_c0_g2_i1:88-1593(+)